MRIYRKWLCLVLGFGFLVSAPPPAESRDWASPLYRQNPLVGKIWRPAANAFSSRETFEADIRTADFVLLGETHNNEDHHRLQAELLGYLINRGRKPAVVFEMINTDRQADIDRWRATEPRNAAGLGPALNWTRSGWPDWKYYQPIAAAALSAGLPIRAGNPPRDLTRKVSREGFSVLGRDVTLLRLDTALPAPSEEAIRNDLYESHCKLIPADRLTPLVAVQRMRDAILADSLLKGRAESAADTAVLIAGSGHARIDHGVPFYLAARSAKSRVVSLALMQVSKGKSKPDDYAAFYDGTLPFDYVWFTPRADSRDRCAELRERFKNSHRKRKATP